MSLKGAQHLTNHGDTDIPFLVSVGIEKKKSSKVANFLTPKKSMLLKLNLSNKSDLWELTKSFGEVTHLHKVLRKEFRDIEVPSVPRIPAKSKHFDSKEWFNFFKIILDDPNFSESGSVRTFINTQSKMEDAMHTQFGEIIKEGPLIYQKRSAKVKKFREIEVYCVIRNRLFYMYRTKYDTSPIGMVSLDDCAVDLAAGGVVSPKDSLVVVPKGPYKKFSKLKLARKNSDSVNMAVGMPMEESFGTIDTSTTANTAEMSSPPKTESRNENDAFTLLPKGSDKYTFVPYSSEDRDSWIAAIDTVAKARSTTHFRVVSTLLVQVEKASHLIAKDANGFSDPYAILHIENQQQKTATIKKTLDPVWHETFHFHVSWYSAVLYLSVWDEDNLKAADFLGKMAIPVAALPVDEEVDIWQALAPRDIKHPVSGFVHLRIKYSFTLEEEEKETKATKVFGVPISEEQPIPEPIKTIMSYVEQNALDVEGLFRISANSIELNELRRSIDQGHELDFAGNSNIHNWSGLIKLWLRELPEPALTFDAYPRFLAALRENSSPDARIAAIKACIQSLPPAHIALLRELLPFLHRVSLASEKTRMTTSNLSVVFSPSLLRQRVETLDSLMVDSADVARVTAILIDQADVLLAP